MTPRRLETLRAHDGAEDSQLSAMDRRVDEPWLTRERVAVAAIGVVFVIGGVSAYVAFGLTRTISVARERVVISAVRADTFREYIPVTATVIPHETTYLDIVEGGQVAEVFAEEGRTSKSANPSSGSRAPTWSSKSSRVRRSWRTSSSSSASRNCPSNRHGWGTNESSSTSNFSSITCHND